MVTMMALGLFVVMTILTGTGNVIGATYRFVWIPAFLLGCVAPTWCGELRVLLPKRTSLDLWRVGWFWARLLVGPGSLGPKKDGGTAS